MNRQREKDVTPMLTCERKTKKPNSARKKLSEMMPGHVAARMVKCGKQRCKCARGELHGPYFYHRMWVGNRHQKRYVRLSDVLQVELACKAHRDFQTELRAGQKAYTLLLARARELFG